MKQIIFFLLCTQFCLTAKASLIDDILKANNLPNCMEFSYTKTETNGEKQTLKSANRIAHNFVANEYNY